MTLFSKGKFVVNEKSYLPIGECFLHYEFIEEDGEVAEWVDGADAFFICYETNSIAEKPPFLHEKHMELILRKNLLSNSSLISGAPYTHGDHAPTYFDTLTLCIPVTFVGGLCESDSYVVAMSIEEPGQFIAISERRLA